MLFQQDYYLESFDGNVGILGFLGKVGIVGILQEIVIDCHDCQHFYR